HDRYLLDNVANKIWFIEDQQIKEYPGTYQEYEEWQAKRQPKPIEKTKRKPVKAEPEQPKAVKNDKSQQTKKLHKELETIETRIADKENALSQTEQLMADEQLYANPAKLAEATQQYEALKA